MCLLPWKKWHQLRYILVFYSNMDLSFSNIPPLVDKGQAGRNALSNVKFGREVQKLLINYHQVHKLLQNKIKL